MKIRRLVTSFALAGAAGLCPSTGSAQVVQASPAVMSTMPQCDTVPADATITADGTSVTKKSGSGAYYYKGCGHYVVDLTVMPTSGATNLSADAFDLPSSPQAGGSRPGNNKEDCTRFLVDVVLYKKNGTTFTKMGDYGVKGIWQNTYCSFQATNPSQPAYAGVGVYFTFQPPTSTYDTYRIAVSARLRTSGQEVAVYSSKNIPRPG
jgi:hypothetical protein